MLGSKTAPGPFTVYLKKVLFGGCFWVSCPEVSDFYPFLMIGEYESTKNVRIPKIPKLNL